MPCPIGRTDIQLYAVPQTTGQLIVGRVFDGDAGVPVDWTEEAPEFPIPEGFAVFAPTSYPDLVNAVVLWGYVESNADGGTDVGVNVLASQGGQNDPAARDSRELIEALGCAQSR